MTHKIRRVRVEEYAYYVNKLRQNVGLVKLLWHKIVTSQTAHTKYNDHHMPLNENSPMKIFCVRHWLAFDILSVVNINIPWHLSFRKYYVTFRPQFGTPKTLRPGADAPPTYATVRFLISLTCALNLGTSALRIFHIELYAPLVCQGVIWV